jgi:putative transposase
MYHKGWRSVYQLSAHIVFVTKYRKPVINQEILQRLYEIFSSTLHKWESRLVEFNGEVNHVHMLIDYPPQVQLSKLIANLKTVSSRLIRKDFTHHIQQFHHKEAFWTASYFVASCGGVTIEQLRKYVEHQVPPDS